MSLDDVNIKSLLQERSFESLKNTFENILESYEIKHFGYVIQNKKEEISAIVSNYPKDWLSCYESNKLYLVDPVFKAVHEKTHYLWKDLEINIEINSPIFDLSRAYGIRKGFSLYSRKDSAALTVLDTSCENSFSRFFLEKIPLVQQLAVVFHQKVKTLNLCHKDNHVLTKREKEILKWAAWGKTNDDIADITSLSRRTIEYHFKNIFDKLAVVNKSNAIYQSVKRNII